MESEDNPFNYLLQLDDFDFLLSSDVLFNLQEEEKPLTVRRGPLDLGDTQKQGGEAADACQTSQNQPKQAALQAIHNDVLQSSWKENSTTHCLNDKENMLSNGIKSDVHSFKMKSTSDSMCPKTPKERKRINDQSYRKRKREKEQNLQADYESLDQYAQKLLQENSQLQKAMRRKITRTARFKLNFHDHESKRNALNLLADLPDMDYVHLKVEKGIVKLKGRFDTEAVLCMLNWFGATRLLSKVYTDPSMPGPSTAPPVRAVKLR